MKRLVFTVTNDLSYDQRMIRICTSVASAGYGVTLVGRKLKNSLPLVNYSFEQHRIFCFFTKGKFFYLEYNLRLFFYLLFKRLDLVCAIDLDTILPCLWISRIKKILRVYDAHELFCEMKEIVERPGVYKIWKKIEQISVPSFDHGYTVNQPIRDEFVRMYDRKYEVIRNMPMLKALTIPMKKERYVLYQGAVNEGRSFETLIPAMKEVPARLFIIGDGNYMTQARQLVVQHGLEEKVIFLGKILPRELASYTLTAWVGITIFENKGLSNYFSLANRFFDYMHAGVPQLGVDYPVYRDLNRDKPVAVLTNDLSPANIASKLNLLLTNDVLYGELQRNCLLQRETFNWQQEEKRLVAFYQEFIKA